MHSFPQVGMFGVTGLLLAVGDKPAASLLSFFMPVLDWIAKWLPLFYIASLVTLPQSLSGIAGGPCACGCMRFRADVVSDLAACV